MKKGERVGVNNGTNDPDFKGRDLSGYTGYIEEIISDNLVGIEWDKPTLRKFGAKFIRKCDRRNLDYRTMALAIDEIEVIE